MRKHKELSTDERNTIIQFMLSSCINGKPKRGKFEEAAVKFSVTRQIISRLWRAAKQQQQQERGLVMNSVSGKKMRKIRILKPIDYAKFTSITLNKRSSYRSITHEMSVRKTTIQIWHRLKLLISHTSAIKPHLTQENKLLRIRFSLESLELDRILNHLRFSNMHNIVHIDEKWFYITKGSHRYYLAPEEEVPHRTCKSKKFIGKIMFICVVSRPLLAENGDVIFDGKIGIFPFIDSFVALRDSKYRKRGTKYTKPIEDVTREVMKKTLIQKILPAIRMKWPRGACKDIQIQQDNAKPHVKDDDPEFRVAATQNGFNMKLVQQPPNSPDTNVLDLGFFNAIQSLQHETACTTLDDLIKVVIESFYNINPHTLNKVFLSLQNCLIEILKVQGQNTYKLPYKLPYMRKDALMRARQLPMHLEVPKEIARAAITFLIEAGQVNGIQEMSHRLGIQERFGMLDLFGSLHL